MRTRGAWEEGFSLVELMMVVGLLAILSVGALAGFRVQISKARDAERLSELDTWNKALFTYQDDHGCYPDDVEMSCGSTFLDPYLAQVPCDPIDNETYKYTYSKTDCNT